MKIMSQKKKISWKNLLSEQDLASSAHVLTGLGGALVGTSLETDNGLTGFQLFIGEVALAFIGWFWSQIWSLPFSVLVGL